MTLALWMRRQPRHLSDPRADIEEPPALPEQSDDEYDRTDADRDAALTREDWRDE